VLVREGGVKVILTWGDSLMLILSIIRKRQPLSLVLDTFEVWASSRKLRSAVCVIDR